MHASLVPLCRAWILILTAWKVANFKKSHWLIRTIASKKSYKTILILFFQQILVLMSLKQIYLSLPVKSKKIKNRSLFHILVIISLLVLSDWWHLKNHSNSSQNRLWRATATSKRQHDSQLSYIMLTPYNNYTQFLPITETGGLLIIHLIDSFILRTYWGSHWGNKEQTNKV